MNYEQKYKEALERARDMMSYKEVRREDMEYLFPELKESTDEGIRKAIICGMNALKKGNRIYFADIYIDDILAWLEKQGEQKSVNKVEPKFKEGDWVVFNGLTLYINEVVKGYYRTISKSGTPNSYDWNIDNAARLWTIKDAKDGDVLCTYECGEPKIVFILKGKTKKPYVLSYHCFYNIMYSYLQDDSVKGCLAPNEEDIKPATKEQRDLLFAKMKDAGYEWDKDKKELKKIEQTVEIPFGAKDSEFQEATYYIPEGYHAEINGNEVVIKKGKQKPSWSKEDEKKRTLLIKILEVNHPNGYFKVNPANTLNMEAISTEELISWLKSL